MADNTVDRSPLGTTAAATESLLAGYQQYLAKRLDQFDSELSALQNTQAHTSLQKVYGKILQPASFVPASPLRFSQGRTGKLPLYVVLCRVAPAEAPPDLGSIVSALTEFANTNLRAASPHLVIGSGGELVQLIDLDDTALFLGGSFSRPAPTKLVDFKNVRHAERASGVSTKIAHFLSEWERRGPFPIEVHIDGGVRTSEALQAELFSRGRIGVVIVNQAAVVTYAATLKETPHGRGGAVDVNPAAANGTLITNRDDLYVFIGKFAASLGLRWGGNFPNFKDVPHIEDPDWQSLPFPPVVMPQILSNPAETSTSELVTDATSVIVMLEGRVGDPITITQLNSAAQALKIISDSQGIPYTSARMFGLDTLLPKTNNPGPLFPYAKLLATVAMLPTVDSGAWFKASEPITAASVQLAAINLISTLQVTRAENNFKSLAILQAYDAVTAESRANALAGSRRTDATAARQAEIIATQQVSAKAGADHEQTAASIQSVNGMKSEDLTGLLYNFSTGLWSDGKPVGKRRG